MFRAGAGAFFHTSRINNPKIVSITTKWIQLNYIQNSSHGRKKRFRAVEFEATHIGWRGETVKLCNYMSMCCGKLVLPLVILMSSSSN
jgi:hypothetical protein